MRTSRNLTIAGLAAAFSLAANVAMADDPCTIDNWSSAVGMDTNGTGFSVGAPSANNRRFAGPCGLRVNVDGTARYLVAGESDGFLAQGETTFNARFYFYINGTLPNDTVIFSALTAVNGTDVLRIRSTSGGMLLDGVKASEFESTAALPIEANKWNFVEISWDQATASLSVNGGAPASISGLNDNLKIGSVRLGNVSGSDGGTFGPNNTPVTIDFDDFDSRRASMPERLLAGDANGDGVINAGDIVAVRSEALGLSTAGGQPDCNKDGAVNAGDIICTRAKALGLQ